MKKMLICTGILIFPAVILSSSAATANSPDTVTTQQQSVLPAANEAEEKEVMEIGGLVTVDASSDLSDITNAVAEIGAVELSANVNVANGIVASITLLAESNLSELSIDQALVEIAPEEKPFSLIFGQQAYNFGLLSTRLISDPTIVDNVETSGPGVVVKYSAGIFTPGLAVTYSHEPADSVKVYTINMADYSVQVSDSEMTKETNYFKGIVNLDVSLSEESAIRLASRFYSGHMDLNLACGFKFGQALLDAELYGEIVNDIDSQAFGYYAGIAYDFIENLETGIRYDGYSKDAFKEIAHRIGIGANYGFKHGIFCALEYSINDITSASVTHEIALQVGLESTIKLPGFQRKTLTRN
jgi:hypothetical protein